jgi:hypothetical protein
MTIPSGKPTAESAFSMLTSKMGKFRVGKNWRMVVGSIQNAYVKGDELAGAAAEIENAGI